VKLNTIFAVDNKTKMTYIAIVDDKKNLLKALQDRFEAIDNYKVVFTAENGKDFLEKMMIARKAITPDIVLMDIDMPIMTGIEAISKARDIYPQTKFLVLSIFDEDDKIFDAIKAGANGYLLKDEPLEKIKEAISNLLNENGAPMSPSIARKALELLMRAKVENIDKKNIVGADFNLTEREKEILNYLVAGLEYKEIANLTSTSPNTVRNHIANIYKKLHVTSKVQAVRLAINKKWFVM
jgi:DNA-binding NarL/FixJ family response regulator